MKHFGVVFPWCDTLSGSRAMEPTGIRDQLEGHDYGLGFWAQHWLALMRIARRLARGRATGKDAPAI